MFRVTLVLGLICLAVCDARRISRTSGDDDRIVGGKTCLISDAPSIASIQRRNVHICGGCIISPRHILTAAHCVNAFAKLPISQASIRVGSTLWSANGDKVLIKEMQKHPKYNEITKDFDYAVVKTAAALEFDNLTIQEAVLADKIPRHGMDCKINGWGLKKEDAELIPNMLQKAEVKAISKKVCASEMFNYGEDISNNMVCAQNPGIDTCQGDSGGPLYCRNSDKSEYKVYAVTSFGRGCGRADLPGVYATVASVLNWIKHQVEYM